MNIQNSEINYELKLSSYGERNTIKEISEGQKNRIGKIDQPIPAEINTSSPNLFF
ncbi:hypothetical protein LEP1GSC116_1435 [Leptospira interrogans serovar Icterohaemorrhagiae str. Verdun HP]|uniref:Uncharacterized protein n=1 Tax=Leptospira interrogans serovar Icterohaemorrhagiae str. Verdun HP TaxID=1049910 RepID=M6RJX4_LEPIR|nr:hypothetical protein LEP1GSC116_1435 [Leptospira interrogans serovar Icterohaemorrhagiae str. Verdun HP]